MFSRDALTLDVSLHVTRVGSGVWSVGFDPDGQTNSPVVVDDGTEIFTANGGAVKEWLLDRGAGEEIDDVRVAAAVEAVARQTAVIAEEVYELWETIPELPAQYEPGDIITEEHFTAHCDGRTVIVRKVWSPFRWTEHEVLIRRDENGVIRLAAPPPPGEWKRIMDAIHVANRRCGWVTGVQIGDVFVDLE